MLQQKQFPHIRITHRAYNHLKELVPALRMQRGTNVSMTDIVSEQILAIPMPSYKEKPQQVQVTVKEERV